MLAAVVETKGKLVIQDVNVPEPGPGQLLIKIKGIALNPTDWKHLDFISEDGAWLGCDGAGEVAKVGEGVKNTKVGDRVASFIHGGRWPEKGSFAEYAVQDESVCWQIPDNIDYEEAASMNVAAGTTFQALSLRLGLESPRSGTKGKGEPILIWGGATAVGIVATQYAKEAGYMPVVTCSPKNNDLLKSYGAAAVFSYRDSDVASKIREAYPDIKYALDCVSEGETTATTAAAMSKDGGEIITLLYVPPEKQGGRENVKVTMTLGYTLMGKAFDFVGMHFPAMPEDRRGAEAWMLQLPKCMKDGQLKPSPLWRQKGGLKALPEGLDLLRQGKVSAQKVTFAI